MDGIAKIISWSARIAWKNSKYCQLNQNRTQNNTPKETKMKVALDNITKHTQKKLRIRQIGNWASLNDIQPRPADRSGAILQLYSSREPNNTLSASVTHRTKCTQTEDQSLHRTTERLTWVNASCDIAWSATTSTHIHITDTAASFTVVHDVNHLWLPVWLRLHTAIRLSTVNICTMQFI